MLDLYDCEPCLISRDCWCPSTLSLVFSSYPKEALQMSPQCLHWNGNRVSGVCLLLVSHTKRWQSITWCQSPVSRTRVTRKQFMNVCLTLSLSLLLKCQTCSFLTTWNVFFLICNRWGVFQTYNCTFVRTHSYNIVSKN